MQLASLASKRAAKPTGMSRDALKQYYFFKGCSGMGVPSGNGIFAVFKNIATML
jgi:hypothetical protein